MDPSFQEYADKLNQSMSSFKGKYSKKEEVKPNEKPEVIVSMIGKHLLKERVIA